MEDEEDEGESEHAPEGVASAVFAVAGSHAAQRRRRRVGRGCVEAFKDAAAR